MKKVNLLLTLFFLLIGIFQIEAQISGTVFRDFNANGTRETGASYNEVGVGGVTVKAYSSAGLEVGSVITSSTGSYSFSGLTLPVRIEFSGYGGNQYSSPVGSSNHSSVQFYNSATTTANFGLIYPEDFVGSTNPKLVTTRQINGLPSGTGSSLGAIVRWDYSDAGQSWDSDNEYLAVNSQVGTLWGVAYDRHTDKLYTSAYLKRHTGLGAAGLGGLYILANAKNSISPTLSSFDLTSLGINFGSVLSNNLRGLSSSISLSQNDPSTYLQVGNVGIGGIDVSADGKKLYLINLFENKLHILDISTSNIQLLNSHLIPDPGCVDGDWKPFSVTEHHGDLYIGGVCNAIQSQSVGGVKAVVYKFDGTNFTNIFEFSLSYTKGYATTHCQNVNKWQPWTTSEIIPCTNVYSHDVISYSQPILSKISFDTDESFILNFRDRTGDQEGWYSFGTTTNFPLRLGHGGGDIIRVCKVNGNYVLQGGSSCINNSNNNEGPNGGEFYPNDNLDITHQEMSLGSAVVFPSTNTFVNVIFDPIATSTAGVRTFDLKSGNQVSAYEIYNSNITQGTLGKANGLGDVELLSDPAPIEIGNRVWLDTDSDGIQDANENPIQGVTVELVKSGSVIATATTDANGNYYFSNGTGTNTVSAIYNITQLMPNMQYNVRIPNVQGGSKQSVLGINNLTIANVGGSGQPDVRDSDGALVGNNAEATVLTTDIPIAGANNHTFDFGFGPYVCPPIPCGTTTVQKN